VICELPADQSSRGAFWGHLERLVQACTLVIDRPKGSAHPRYPDLIYPLDYGYLQNSWAMDGDGVDGWIGSLPDRRLGSILITVDLLKQDVEIKLLLGCTPAEEQIVLDFHHTAPSPAEHSMRTWLLRRNEGVRPDSLRLDLAAPGRRSAARMRRGALAKKHAAALNNPGAVLLALLRSRRSTRHFLPGPIEEQTLLRLLEAATWAPSAHHRQPWRFVVLCSAAARARLVQAMEAEHRRDLVAGGLPADQVEAQLQRSRQRILEAPAVVLLCQDISVEDQYTDSSRQQAETWMGGQGVAMAGFALLLVAHAEGLAGVWMCAPLFAQAAARQALDLPETWLPQGLVLLGYPAKMPEARPRIPVEQVTRFIR
jgi:coenzyme F420-0:L-glutamate ligase / coenzyme F420-1:gamma-L-glutamate ligase